MVGWIDRFGTWWHDLLKRIDADQDLEVDLEIGARLVAAERGSLHNPSGLRQQIERLLSDPRAEAAAKLFFRELLGLGSELQKDKSVYPSATPALWSSMRGEIDLLFTHSAFGREPDLRRVFQARSTFVLSLIHI